MSSTSHIVIERKAISSNIFFIRSLCNDMTEISAVVKGNVYFMVSGRFYPCWKALAFFIELTYLVDRLIRKKLLI